MYSVSRESTRVAPRPPKLFTPFFVWGWSQKERHHVIDVEALDWKLMEVVDSWLEKLRSLDATVLNNQPEVHLGPKHTLHMSSMHEA